MQFGGVQLQQQVQSTEEQDRNDDGKIADEGAELEHIEEEERRCGQSTVLYPWVWSGEGRKEAAAVPLLTYFVSIVTLRIKSFAFLWFYHPKQNHFP